jgi:hypothetical protein
MSEAPTSVVWYKSNVLRGLLVAAVAQVLVLTGAAEDIAPGQAEQLVNSLLVFVELAALAWAGWSRTTMPNPPVTLTKGGE